MGNIDERWKGLNYPVARLEVPAITLPNGASAEVTTTVPLNMTVKQIIFRAGNATNSITFTLTIKDDNGSTLMSKATIAENTTTVLLSTKATADFDEFLINGVATIGVTPSGDPGGSGVSVNVDIYGE